MTIMMFESHQCCLLLSRTTRSCCCCWSPCTVITLLMLLSCFCDCTTTSSSAFTKYTSITTTSLDSSDGVHFWILTDTHMDKAYSTRGSPQNICHETKNFSIDGSSGFYGDYGCEAPISLVESTLDAMKAFHPNPDFILWLGDSIRHRRTAPKMSKAAAYRQLNKTAHMIRKRFGNIAIYPAIGNHDNSPSQLMPEHNYKFYESYLSKSNWHVFINTPSMKKTFTTGGYYSTYLRPNLKLMMLNTILWIRANTYSKKLEDPAEQFKWLQHELQESQQNHDKVIVAGHAAPGYFEMWFSHFNTSFLYSRFNDRFVQLILNYSHIITFQLYSHSHTNTFRLYSIKEKPVSSAISTSSISPNYRINPAIKLYTMNSSTFQLEKYMMYNMNLTRANIMYQHNRTTDVKVLWKLLCDTSSSDYKYKLPNLNVESLTDFYNWMLSSNETFNEYVRINHADAGVNFSQKTYVKNACAIKYSFIEDFEDCFSRLNNQTNRTLIYEALKIITTPGGGGSGDILGHAQYVFMIAVIVITIFCFVLLVVLLIIRWVNKKTNPCCKSVPSDADKVPLLDDMQLRQKRDRFRKL